MTADQLDLFNPAASRNAREQAITRVETHAQSEFKQKALKSLLAVAHRHSDFTTDDLVRFMTVAYPGVTTHDNRAWGPVMRIGAKEGWIVNTGQVRESNMVSNHRRPKAVWRSRLIGPWIKDGTGPPD